MELRWRFYICQSDLDVCVDARWRSPATHLHQAGVPLRAIQRITGHESLSALERYLDISGTEAAEQQQAALNSQWEG